jgi:hypothetical protein
MRSAADWPALAPSRGTLFEVPDALGYNPVQLPRYWRYVRATNELSVFYNASVLNLPSVQDVRLLGLRYLVIPIGVRPPLPGHAAVRANRYVLWELFDAQPAATVTEDVTVVEDVEEALAIVTAPGFDPARRVVIERGLILPDRPGRDTSSVAELRAVSPTELRVELDPSAVGVLTIRSAFDPGWRATVDGRPVGTLAVDGFLLGVVLDRLGAEEVVLTYHDDAVRLGLWLGAAAWAVLLGAPIVALGLERRRTRRPRPATPAA